MTGKLLWMPTTLEWEVWEEKRLIEFTLYKHLVKKFGE